MILAIDTATDQASVAVAGDGTPLAEWSWTSRGNHSRHLTRVIRELLELAGCPLSSLSAVAVASGPGSFNRLRVGMSEAKGLALALDIPLVGIATLDVIGYQASQSSSDVWAILPAGREQVSLAHYRGKEKAWGRVSDYRTTSMEEATHLVEDAALLAGSGAEAVAVALDSKGSRPAVEPPAWRLRRAGFLAELGRRYLEAGGNDQLDNLEPLYLRRSAAEEKRAAHRQE